MAKMLNRLWTGIVASLAGIAIGIVVMIILIQSKMPMDRALSACWIAQQLALCPASCSPDQTSRRSRSSRLSL